MVTGHYTINKTINNNFLGVHGLVVIDQYFIEFIRTIVVIRAFQRLITLKT